MAGLIAGHGERNGVTGVAPAAKILPIRTFRVAPQSHALALGIRWAGTHGAQVINVSLTTAPSRDLEDAISLAQARDALVIAGSGDSSTGVLLGYPAAMPGVLAVGALGRDGEHADFSVTGPKVEICAPGVGLVTTGPDGDYREVDGTSAATAIVSGAAALVRSKFPALSAPEVVHRLTATATDIGPPGRDDECGHGALNIVKALTADIPRASAEPPTPEPPAPGPPTLGPAAAAPPAGQPGSRRFLTVAAVSTVVATTGAVLAYLASTRPRTRRRP